MGTNPMMPQTNTKKKSHTYTSDNVLEALRGVGSSVGKTIAKDVVVKGAGDILSSLVGAPKSGELKQNQSIEFPFVKEAPMAIPMRKIERTPVSFSQEDIQTKQQIEAVRKELKALSESVKNLNQDVRKTILEAPVAPGVYHMNFYEQLRTYLQALRLQIEDSRTWLTAMTTKKGKQGYWGMYKKHGTTFGLSGERSIATSAG